MYQRPSTNTRIADLCQGETIFNGGHGRKIDTSVNLMLVASRFLLLDRLVNNTAWPAGKRFTKVRDLNGITAFEIGDSPGHS